MESPESSAPQFSGQQAAVLNALSKRDALQTPCPRCTNSKFDVLDGFLYLPIKDHTEGAEFDTTKNLVVAVLICKHCGYCCHHAIGGLGILHAG